MMHPRSPSSSSVVFSWLNGRGCCCCCCCCSKIRVNLQSIGMFESCVKKKVKSNRSNNLVVQVNKWGWFLGWPKYPPSKLIAKAPRQWWEKSFPCGFRPMFKGELLVFGKGKLCLCFICPTNNSLNAWIVLGIVKKTLSRFIVFCRGSVLETQIKTQSLQVESQHQTPAYQQQQQQQQQQEENTLSSKSTCHFESRGQTTRDLLVISVYCSRHIAKEQLVE